MPVSSAYGCPRTCSGPSGPSGLRGSRPLRPSPAPSVRRDSAEPGPHRRGTPGRESGPRGRRFPRWLPGLLSTTLHCPLREFRFAPSSPIVLDTLYNLLLSLCLLCLWSLVFYVFFFMGEAGWVERLGIASERRVSEGGSRRCRHNSESPNHGPLPPTPPFSLSKLSLQMFWVPSELGGMFRIPTELTSRPSPCPFPCCFLIC